MPSPEQYQPAQHSRREFLRGRAAAQALRHALGDRLATMESETRPQGVLMSVRRRAMACDFEVQLAAAREDAATEHVLRALDLVEALEAQMSVYRSDSEVAELNRQAAERPVAVEPRLFAVLQLAQQIHHDTDGAFDITSGPLSEVWGFSRRAGRLPSEAEIAAALERVGMDHVALNPTDYTVTFDRGGVELNLNSIGKGYALDRMAELLEERQVDDYLLHGGRSSVLARGRCPGAQHAGWTIGVRHPLRPGERLAEFYLVDQALATSGAATQFFHHRGRRYGHVLDPRTGHPAATGIHSATVIAPTAAEADALSTAFYVLGPEGVARYCDAHRHVAAVLVMSAEHEAEVRLQAFGLADLQWRVSDEGLVGGDAASTS